LTHKLQSLHFWQKKIKQVNITKLQISGRLRA